MDLPSKDLAPYRPAQCWRGCEKKEKSLVPRRDAVLPQGCGQAGSQRSEACGEKRNDYVSRAATGNCEI